MSDTYRFLAAPFAETFTDTRGGIEITYLSGEQVVSRLNEVLGPGSWSFRVTHQDIHPEADEVWCLGELEADIDGTRVVRQQYGSQKIKRSRSTASPLDIGFDLKGATTDALKKCASWIGVGLYLSHKEPKPAGRQRSQPTNISEPRPAVVPVLTCQLPTGVRFPSTGKLVLCGKRLTDVPERNWTFGQLANAGMKTSHKLAMCWDCYQATEGNRNVS